MRIKITSDSTCDLSHAQIVENDIHIYPLTVVKNGEAFLDNVTITPAEIFAHVASGGSLCSTAAGPYVDYQEVFSRYTDEYDGILHISLGSGFSSSYQNACLAAAEFSNVRVVDSMNLSTGQGHVVLKACELAKTANSLDELHAEVQAYAPRVEASFVLDQLAYMVKGGRCSAAAALGANLLNLKPCIEVRDGKMGVVKKYRGTYAKCLANYVKDRLEGRDDIIKDLLFLTYTEIDETCLTSVKNSIDQYGSDFTHVEETVAGCTISCHCGPRTLGILFVRK